MSGFLLRLCVCAFLVRCFVNAEEIKSHSDRLERNLQIKFQNGAKNVDTGLETISGKAFYDTFIENKNDKNVKRSEYNGAPEKSFMDPSMLSDLMPEYSEHEKHLESKILQSVSPFEDSNLDIHVLESEDEEKENLRSNEYESNEFQDKISSSESSLKLPNLYKEEYVVSDDQALDLKTQNFEEARYNVVEDVSPQDKVEIQILKNGANTIDENKYVNTKASQVDENIKDNISYNDNDLKFSNETSFQLHSGMGMEHSSSAEAKLIVNNVTVEDFYEDRYNNSKNVINSEAPIEDEQVLGLHKQNLKSKKPSKLLVGVVEHFDASGDIKNNNEEAGTNIRHLDDFLNYLLKNKNDSSQNGNESNSDVENEIKLGNALDTSSFDTTVVKENVEKSDENVKHLDDFITYLIKNENNSSINNSGSSQETLVGQALDIGSALIKSNATIKDDQENTKHLNNFINYLIKNENNTDTASNEENSHKLSDKENHVANALNTETSNFKIINKQRSTSTEAPVNIFLRTNENSQPESQQLVGTTTENYENSVGITENTYENPVETFTHDFVFPKEDSEGQKQSESNDNVAEATNKSVNITSDDSSDLDARVSDKLFDNPAFEGHDYQPYTEDPITHTTMKHEQEKIVVNEDNNDLINAKSSDYYDSSDTGVEIDDYGVDVHAGGVDVNINTDIIDAVDNIFHHGHFRTPETIDNSTLENANVSSNEDALQVVNSTEISTTVEYPNAQDGNTSETNNTEDNSSSNIHTETSTISPDTTSSHRTTLDSGEEKIDQTTPSNKDYLKKNNSDDEPYVIHSVTIGKDYLSELRSDLHASLDDIAQRMIGNSANREAELRSSREELEIVNITADTSFKYGEGIHSWKSLTTRNGVYLFGIGLTEIVLIRVLQSENKLPEYKLLQILPLQKPRAFDFFHLRLRNSWDTAAVVAVENEICWYKITQEDQMSKNWRWVLHSKVNFVKFFEYNDDKYIFTLEPLDGDQGVLTANIYGFSMDHKAFWLRQRLDLECEAEMAAFSFVADLVYLAIPQRKLNQVVVYKFVDGVFLQHDRLQSSDVDFVSAFSVGHKNFLALGGLDHAIYRLDIHGIHKEAVLDSTFDKVEFYLPIHVRNYRDDLIVLVQHEIDHESHTSQHIEALVWTEDGFVTSPHELCNDHGDISYGFQCLVDEETATGIIGSAVIQHKHTSSIVIPRISPNSELYIINTKLVPTEDPYLAELNSLRRIKEKLEKAFIHQTQVVEEVKKILDNSLSANGDNIVKTRWEVNELNTKVYREESDQNAVQWTDGFLAISDIKFNKTDTSVHIPILLEEADKALASVLDMPQLMKDAVKQKARSVTLAHDLTVVEELKIEGGWKAESICFGDINGENVRDLFQRLMYHKQTVTFDGAVKFDKVFVDNLVVDTINDVPAADILLYKAPEVFIQGNVEFLQEVEFDKVFIKSGGLLGGIQFQDIQRADVKIESLNLEEAKVLGDFKVRKFFNGFVIDDEELSDATNGRRQRDIGDSKQIRVLGDTAFETINGLNWKDFISTVVWKNAPRTLEHKMNIKGNIICPEPCQLHMPYINGLSFPSDLVLSGAPISAIQDFSENQYSEPQYVVVPNSQSPSQVFEDKRRFVQSASPGVEQNPGASETISISGKKSFDKLNIGSLDCPGSVNGIAPEDVITLQGEQHIKGPIAFENLKVTEGLHVGGKLTGKYLDNFETNPTLKDSNVISSSTIFRHLEVQGPIFVQNINGSSLENILNDVVYKDQEEVVIHGYKQFENCLTIQENLELTSNRINSIDTSTILTKDTQQILTLQNVQGNIEFKELTLEGYVDDVNITDLYINTVKLQGDQYISSDITFNSRTNFAELSIDNLQDKPAEDLYTIDEVIYLGSSAKFDRVIVDHLYADEVYIESKYLNERNLTEISEKCFSLTRPQNIEVDFYAEVIDTNTVTSQNVQIIPTEIGGVRKRRNVTQILSFGDEEIDELIIEGKVTTGKINGYDFKDIVRNAIWLNRENYATGHLIFMDGFTVAEINSKGTVNGYDFNEFINDLVLASDDIKIHGHKIFASGLIADNIHTNTINGIEVENILTKNTDQIIHSDLVINGDVSMDEVSCNGRFNGVSLEEIKERYSYEEGYHVIHGNGVFSKPVYIKSLLMGEIQNVNLHEFLPHVIAVNDDSTIPANLVFENDVVFGSDLEIWNTYNGLDLKKFLESVVLVDRESTIAYPVVFEDNTIFADDLKFSGGINAATIFGCDLQYWKDNRISIIDGGAITGRKTFFNINTPNQGWTTRLLNGRDLKNVFTLNTDQVIPQNLYFSTLIIEESCVALGTVNGKNLTEEVANTLMTSSDKEQIIEAPTNFSVVHVRDFLKTSALVNDKYNLQNPFTLDTDQTISNPGHIFDSVLTPYMDINGTTAGVDFNEWTENALRRSGNDQIIKGRWYIDTADFQGNVLGDNYKLNNRDIHDLADEVAKQKVLFDMHRKELQEEYSSFCYDIEYLRDLSQKSLYLLKHFEETQFITTPHIRSLHVYQNDNNGQYSMIMNYGGCKSTIFKWDPRFKKFTHAYSFETGVVDEWISVQNREGSKFLVSRSDLSRRCKFASRANVWYVEDLRVKHLFDLGSDVKEILAGVEGEFYTVDESGVKEYTLRSYGDEPVVSGKWNMYTDESVFVPREAGFDLSLSDGKSVTKLIKSDRAAENADNMFGSEPIISRSISSSGISSTECPYLPRRGAGEVEVLTVGLGSSLRQLVAVSVLENATVHGNHDFIKIYDDVMEGRLFQTLSCVRPSSLVSIHFGQGQTILAFIEDETNIQVYDYRGIEGFVHLYSFKFPATSLKAVSLPVETKTTSMRYFLLASGSQGLRVLEALMYGDRALIKDDLRCRTAP